MGLSSRSENCGLSVCVEQKLFDGRKVLSNLKFSAVNGEFITILGPSGCGKTTLLRLICGLDLDYVGQIVINGTSVAGPGPDRGLVFQESRLLPWYTVDQNIGYGLPSGIPTHERTKRTSVVRELVGLNAASDLLPKQLSGGMARRVSIARALINLPAVLLLDEPFNGLDLAVRLRLARELSVIHERAKLSTILVTHDIGDAVFLSDRIVVLGGTPARVMDVHKVQLEKPRNRTTEGFIRLAGQISEQILC